MPRQLISSPERKRRRNLSTFGKDMHQKLLHMKERGWGRNNNKIWNGKNMKRKGLRIFVLLRVGMDNGGFPPPIFLFT